MSYQTRHDNRSNTGRQIISPSSGQSQQQQLQNEYSPRTAKSIYEEEKQMLAADNMNDEERAVMSALSQHKCICAICTCGKHHCPASVHTQAHYDQSLSSHYQANYPRHNASIVRARAPPTTVFTSDAPFEGESLTKHDYRSYAGAKPAPLMRPNQTSTVGGEDARDFKSENAANYKSHGYVRREAAVPSHTMHISNEPFQGGSTSADAYQRWSARPAESIKPFSNQSPINQSDDRDFLTENGSKYNEKGFVARKSAVPFTSQVFDSEPFSGESSMKADFQHWSQKPAESFKPRWQEADVKKDERQFRTEKQDSFTHKGTGGVIRMHAPPSQVLESAPFEGESLTKHDYRSYAGAKPAPLMRPNQTSTVGGEDARDFKSENAANYKSHGYVRREAAVPSHTMHISNEPFQGGSTSADAYQRWSARPAESIKPFSNQSPINQSDDRDFLTENGSKYNEKGFVARKTVVPFTSQVFDNTEDRTFTTEARSHFTQKPIEVCPSSRLVAQSHADTLSHGGHLLYHHDKESGRYLSVDQKGQPIRR